MSHGLQVTSKVLLTARGASSIDICCNFATSGHLARTASVSFLVQISGRHFVETGLSRLGSPVVQVNAVDTTAGFELFAESPGVVVEGAASRKACIGII